MREQTEAQSALVTLAENIVAHSWHQPGLQQLARLALQTLNSTAQGAKPIYQLMDDCNWYDAEPHIYADAVERGDVCRVVYAAPPVLVAPQLMTTPDEPAGDDYSAEARANWLYLKGKADGWNECAQHVTETITGENHDPLSRG